MKKYCRLCAVWIACVCLALGGCGVHTADLPLSESTVISASVTDAYASPEDYAAPEDYAVPENYDPTGAGISTTSAPGTLRSEGSSPETTAPAASASEKHVSDAPTGTTAAAATTAAASASAAVTAAASTAAPSATTRVTTVPSAQAPANEIRAVWISYLDISNMRRGSESAFRSDAKEMIRKMRDGKMNTVFLQVRPASDAMYRSSLYPYSAYISGTEGKDPGYDALKIFCDCANEAGLSLHAWINPFRVGDASKFDQKAASNPAKKILSDGDPDNDSRVVRVGGSLYFDPADRDNQELILAGVRELLQNYAIGGVHIDDYFYPSTDLSIDQKDYDAYTAQGGTESRDNWRRTQINALVSSMYTCVKSFGQQKVFSISPAMEIEKNRSTYYADVSRWAAYGGYCDWLIPQVYVGFDHQTHPFRDTVRQWLSLKRSGSVRLLFGLAAYKCGTEDKYAGSGSREWIENTDILSRQIAYLRSLDGSSGFALFSYAYTFGEKMSNNSNLEMKNVMDML